MGPFMVNYAKDNKLAKMDIKKYSSGIRFLVKTNIKHKLWEIEKEFRYVCLDPNGEYNYYEPKKDLCSRKYYYDPKSVKGVVLAYDFFSKKELDFEKKTAEYDIVNVENIEDIEGRKKKVKFLDNIIESGYLIYQIVKNRNEYKLEIEPQKIYRLNKSEYKIEHSGIVLYHTPNKEDNM